MAAVPVMGMGEKDDAGFFPFKYGANDGDGFGPEGRITVARFLVYALESAGACGDQVKTDELAGLLQFLKAFALAFFFAALSHGYVDHSHFGLAEEAQWQCTDDAFVIGVRGEYQGFVCVRSKGRSLRWRETAERNGLPFLVALGVFGNEVGIGLHSSRYGG